LKNIIIATSRKWNEWIKYDLEKKFDGEYNFHLITQKSELSEERLNELKPEFVFIPHWSFIIPSSIHQNHDCVIFHMTDLPYGRGGSPLQNLIVRGHKETKVSAIKCVEELDGGDIYLKKDLSLSGTAQDIFERMSTVIFDMIVEMLETSPVPQKQVGDITSFQRRKPHQSSLSEVTSLEQCYDYIRMLDAEGYPKAYLNNENLNFEFYQVSKEDGVLNARVRIQEK
jgi:methionyl-tRNA formyltransferase